MLASKTFSIKEDLLKVKPVRFSGRVIEVKGAIFYAQLIGVAVGDLVLVEQKMPIKEAIAKIPRQTSKGILAQVVGFNNRASILTPYGSLDGVSSGACVQALGHAPRIKLNSNLIGTVVDHFGAQIHEFSLSFSKADYYTDVVESIYKLPPSPIERTQIKEIFVTGVRAIDAFLTLGKGQRICIFAEPGVGKSSLMGMIAKHSKADINLIALIGERSREVQDLIINTLDQETRARSVIVVSSSDQAAICKVNAAYTATRIAEYFRDQGKNVLLQVDSLSRLTRALRELGLAAGEIPVRRGYPPSVFSKLPSLVERAGTNQKGSITAFYTALLSSDIDNDPMIEEIKGLTDGHIILRQDLAELGQYPAIDIINSISRLSTRLLEPRIVQIQKEIKTKILEIAQRKEILMLGGSNIEELGKIKLAEHKIYLFLNQGQEFNSSYSETLSQLEELSLDLKEI